MIISSDVRYRKLGAKQVRYEVAEKSVCLGYLLTRVLETTPGVENTAGIIMRYKSPKQCLVYRSVCAGVHHGYEKENYLMCVSRERGLLSMLLLKRSIRCRNRLE
jgi:hypothetical protein